MIHTDRRMRLCTVLLLLILVFIWGNSLMPASVSRAFSDWVGQVLGVLSAENGPDDPGSGILRKIAHFTEFAALGLLLGWRFGMLGKQAYLPLIWGVAAAGVDETIQIFVPERGPSLWDVGIDGCGVLTGMILLHFGHTYFQKKHNKTHGG